VEERLDGLQGVETSAPRATPRLAWVAWPGLGLVLAAVLLFLVGALHPRGANGTVTGDVPTTAPLSSAIQVAERNVVAHPRSVDARLALGNAYLDAGKNGPADRSYRAAMHLAPSRPEAPTLDAMALGAEGKTGRALLQLGAVERSHPTYARAWLLDGLLSSKSRSTYPRARTAWSRFLRLEPRNPLSRSVRTWLKTLK
jgi:cytochrome c-type biogenesis protein CcmH/NrfG